MKKQKITRYSSEELERLRLQGKSKTNWSKVRSLTDEEIDFSDSPEIPPEEFVKRLMRKEAAIPKQKEDKQRR